MDGSDERATVKLLAQSIERMLKHNKAEFKTAARGKQQLLSTKYWEEFHLQLIKACTDTGNAEEQPAPVLDQSVVQSQETEEGNETPHPGQVQKRERDTEPTGETESRKATKKGQPPPLPIVVEILAQVIPSVKSPKEMKNYASARETLLTLDPTTVTDETVYLLENIRPEIKTMEDLLDTAEAIKQIEKIKGVNVIIVKPGSLIFYLQCTDLSGLGDLWFMYKSGELSNMLHSSLIREETLQQLCAESVSVTTNINMEDFRKALVYLLTTSSAEDQPIPRLPQEYPLYQPHTHTTASVLDVLHLDGTNLARSSGKQQELHIPPATQTEDSLDHLGAKLRELKMTDDQQTTEAHATTDVPEVISELVSLDIRELEQLMGKPRKRTSSMGSQTSGYQTGTPGSGPSRPYSPTGEVETQTILGTLLAELNTPAVMEDKVQQFDLYCQIGDLYRTKLHNLQSALQYYQNMLECSQELSEDTKQAKAYNRLGLTYDILGLQQEAFRNHEKALAIYRVETRNETNICVAYKNLASSLALSGQVSDAKTNYESALAVAMETGNKTEQMDIYCKLGDLHREQLQEPQESHKYYTEMLALARDLGRKDWESLAYNRLGHAHYDMGEHEESLEWYRKHLKMSQESGDKTEQITAHKNIARSYKALGKLDLARSHYQSAMTIAMETGNKTEQMDISLQLGDLHREQLHEPQESHKYYTEMLALARDLGRKDWEGLAYNRLGHAHYDMGEHEESLEWYKKDLKMRQESGDKTEQITAHQCLAVSYQALGKLDLARSHYQSAMTIAMETGNKTEHMDIYCKLGDLHRKQLHEPQESHKYYTEMLALARDLGRKDRESQAYNRLGVAHYDMGEHEESLEWYKKNMKMCQESGDKTEQITAHQNMADSYKALGKLDQARSHYQSAMTIAMETGNKTEQMDIYCGLGDLHREQLHEPQESLKYYTEMLALARDLGRKDKESQAYNRLGLAHYDMGEQEESLEWYKKDLNMRQESGDKTNQMTAHQCLAASYMALGKLDLARSHYQSAMTFAMETGNKTQQMYIYCELGDLHREQLHEPQTSHKYYTEMSALARDLGRKDRESLAYNRLGRAHYDMGEHEDSLEWDKKSLKMRQESGDKTGQITAHQDIAVNYKELGKLDLARSHYQSAMTIAMETGNKQKQEDIAKKLANL
ncbi:PREDICTED: tetratricopeptide repeat protein 28-like [Branchiostoma belcheri]|uniref:Tetratricopeptide repeat protein 28-like n=1 Tax=Branchiostoma belcheri TaxID=7741 RepID=A0A6P4ZQC9_BRABE|nr:PREDICTED: tetratricopeptide repeat protein 28-like [Branchiostoma belcheri]